jgi:3-oxoacyl-[acyl-carrier-protein] synthase II
VVTGVGVVTPLGVSADELHSGWIGGRSGIEAGIGACSDFAPTSVMPAKEARRSDRFAQLAMRHGLRGPAFVVMSACASGAHAIGAAARMIEAGDADAVLAGGAEATLTPLASAAFAAMDATSVTGISRPFDARRDGFVMGEGAGVLVLESAELASARGARIIRALDDAGLTPSALHYVNAHGTSTPLNDRSETEALKRALGEYAGRVPVSSTKSAIGHLLGAAGAVEAIATLLALRQRVAPPTLGYEQQEEGLDLDYVPDGPRPLPPRQNGRGPKAAVAISNSFGFGGHNAVLCLAGAA